MYCGEGPLDRASNRIARRAQRIEDRETRQTTRGLGMEQRALARDLTRAARSRPLPGLETIPPPPATSPDGEGGSYPVGPITGASSPGGFVPIEIPGAGSEPGDGDAAASAGASAAAPAPATGGGWIWPLLIGGALLAIGG